MTARRASQAARERAGAALRMLSANPGWDPVEWWATILDAHGADVRAACERICVGVGMEGRKRKKSGAGETVAGAYHSAAETCAYRIRTVLP